jgi:hypothetical protein
MTDAQRPRSLIRLVRELPDVPLTDAQADFMSCMLGAVLAALPAFLEAFMKCLGTTGNGSQDGYNPDTAQRC